MNLLKGNKTGDFMSDLSFLILIISVFSIFEIFVLYQYLKLKKAGRFIENLFVFSITVLFLCLKDYLHLPVYNFIFVLLIITILGHTFIGEYLDVYHKSKTYDRFLHLIGSFTFSLFSYSIIADIFKPQIHSAIYIAIYAAALGVSIGVIFELIEFMVDTVGTKKKYQKNQHGLADTNYDLLFNVIGAAIAGYVAVIIF